MKIDFYRISGFHLLEVLITLAIISILAVISLPLYTQHITDANRLEAAQTLSRVAVAMEQYHIEHQSYQDATLSKLQFPDTIAKNNYHLVIESADDANYLLSAEPVGKQLEHDLCGTLSLYANGDKAVSGARTIEECW